MVGGSRPSSRRNSENVIQVEETRDRFVIRKRKNHSKSENKISFSNPEEVFKHVKSFHGFIDENEAR